MTVLARTRNNLPDRPTHSIAVQQMWLLLIKTNLSSRRRGDPISKHIKGLGMNKYLVMGPERARNQERLCQRGPAAICWEWTCTWTFSFTHALHGAETFLRNPDGQEIVHYSWNPRHISMFIRARQWTLSCFRWIQMLTSYFFKIHFNVVLSYRLMSPKWYLLLRVSE
jgi:hypothetical protein